jgi:hypothetical protein
LLTAFAPPAVAQVDQQRAARPSGLDGACAQMIGGQLRDGHRMLFPCSLRPEQTALRSMIGWSSKWLACCSIVSGRVRFTRLLRFMFHDFDR